MKAKAFLAIIAIALAGVQAGAQEKKEQQRPPQRPNAEQTAKRLSRAFMLDDDASAKFIPLYTEYRKALQDCLQQPEKTGKQELTDKDIEKRMETRFACQQKMLDVQKEYYGKFKQILTARQTEKVMQPASFRRVPKPQGPQRLGHDRRLAPHQGHCCDTHPHHR